MSTSTATTFSRCTSPYLAQIWTSQTGLGIPEAMDWAAIKLSNEHSWAATGAPMPVASTAPGLCHHLVASMPSTCQLVINNTGLPHKLLKTLSRLLLNMGPSPSFLHLHLSFHHRGHWGTTGDFTTSFFHFSLFSTALWDLANSRPVHSLILSSRLFFCLVFFSLSLCLAQWTWDITPQMYSVFVMFLCSNQSLKYVHL